jgi:hypothetical protein
VKPFACGLVVLASCSDNGNIKLDGGPCWPLPATPGGQVELGTGELAFQPMPDTLQLTRSGAQRSAYIPINARIRGMPPGNPDDLLDPKNPKTKVSAVLVETGAPLGLAVDCPASMPYVAAGEPGAYDMLHDLQINLATIDPMDLDSKQATLTVEVVGADGRYAIDQKIVTLIVPPPAARP